VVAGAGVTSAVLSVIESMQDGGRYVPLGELGEANAREVDIRGKVIELWEPSNPKIAQVGLLEDESGRVKVTVWKASDQPWMEEGDTVEIHRAATSWYQGRVSVALTGWSRVQFPERGRWWE
jgi:ssDNA-binding replication factor A large subunit